MKAIWHPIDEKPAINGCAALIRVTPLSAEGQPNDPPFLLPYNAKWDAHRNCWLDEATDARFPDMRLPNQSLHWALEADVLQVDFDLVAHLRRQREFSERVFGPGERTAGILDHIRKELLEIEAAPGDVMEWVDVVLLALDGAWRAGFEPGVIVEAIAAKQLRNESRIWPDWRTAKQGTAIEHVRQVQA